MAKILKINLKRKPSLSLTGDGRTKKVNKVEVEGHPKPGGSNPLKLSGNVHSLGKFRNLGEIKEITAENKWDNLPNDAHLYYINGEFYVVGDDNTDIWRLEVTDSGDFEADAYKADGTANSHTKEDYQAILTYSKKIKDNHTELLTELQKDGKNLKKNQPALYKELKKSIFNLDLDAGNLEEQKNKIKEKLNANKPVENLLEKINKLEGKRKYLPSRDSKDSKDFLILPSEIQATLNAVTNRIALLREAAVHPQVNPASLEKQIAEEEKKLEKVIVGLKAHLTARLKEFPGAEKNTDGEIEAEIASKLLNLNSDDNDKKVDDLNKYKAALKAANDKINGLKLDDNSSNNFRDALRQLHILESLKQKDELLKIHKMQKAEKGSLITEKGKVEGRIEEAKKKITQLTFEKVRKEAVYKSAEAAWEPFQHEDKVTGNFTAAMPVGRNEITLKDGTKYEVTPAVLGHVIYDGRNVNVSGTYDLPEVEIVPEDEGAPVEKYFIIKNGDRWYFKKDESEYDVIGNVPAHIVLSEERSITVEDNKIKLEGDLILPVVVEGRNRVIKLADGTTLPIAGVAPGGKVILAEEKRIAIRGNQIDFGNATQKIEELRKAKSEVRAADVNLKNAIKELEQAEQELTAVKQKLQSIDNQTNEITAHIDSINGRVKKFSGREVITSSELLEASDALKKAQHDTSDKITLIDNEEKKGIYKGSLNSFIFRIDSLIEKRQRIEQIIKLNATDDSVQKLMALPSIDELEQLKKEVTYYQNKQSIGKVHQDKLTALKAKTSAIEKQFKNVASGVANRLSPNITTNDPSETLEEEVVRCWKACYALNEAILKLSIGMQDIRDLNKKLARDTQAANMTQEYIDNLGNIKIRLSQAQQELETNQKLFDELTTQASAIFLSVEGRATGKVSSRAKQMLVDSKKVLNRAECFDNARKGLPIKDKENMHIEDALKGCSLLAEELSKHQKTVDEHIKNKSNLTAKSTTIFNVNKGSGNTAITSGASFQEIKFTDQSPKQITTQIINRDNKPEDVMLYETRPVVNSESKVVGENFKVGWPPAPTWKDACGLGRSKGEYWEDCAKRVAKTFFDVHRRRMGCDWNLEVESNFSKLALKYIVLKELGVPISKIGPQDYYGVMKRAELEGLNIDKMSNLLNKECNKLKEQYSVASKEYIGLTGEMNTSTKKDLINAEVQARNTTSDLKGRRLRG